MSNGGAVREYVNGGGVVFAVTWRGPGRPDLAQLFGDRFSTMQADTAGRLDPNKFSMAEEA